MNIKKNNISSFSDYVMKEIQDFIDSKSDKLQIPEYKSYESITKTFKQKISMSKYDSVLRQNGRGIYGTNIIKLYKYEDNIVLIDYMNEPYKFMIPYTYMDELKSLLDELSRDKDRIIDTVILNSIKSRIENHIKYRGYDLKSIQFTKVDNEWCTQYNVVIKIMAEKVELHYLFHELQACIELCSPGYPFGRFDKDLHSGTGFIYDSQFFCSTIDGITTLELIGIYR